MAEIFTLPDDLSEALLESLGYGFIAEIKDDGHHLYYIEKALVDRVKGVKIKIYTNEHPPPHFHVQYGECNASFALDDGRHLEGGKGAHKIKKNVELYYKSHRSKLIQFWNNTRPTDCPVGPIVI